jgi:translation initiation factor eIF-2B subunit gamma
LHANDIIAEDKNNNLMSSEGMEATEEEMQSSFADEEAIMDAE